uniref:SMP domain-containing protein n=1 Tax=Oryza meridionalis TaxID=40149 RepID=A0A0E0BY27_9ORYZ
MRHRPNDNVDADEEKINKATTLKDVVGGAAEVLLANKVDTREDANKVAATAAQNDQSRLGIQTRIVRMRFSFPRGKQSPMVGTKCV